MQLRLAVSNRLRDTMGDNYQCVFGEHGGTIGRAEHNEWVLPDQRRYVSSVHASIEARNDGFYLVDTSMNGVFVNGSSTALGPTTPVELRVGMKLRMGNYHIVVAEVKQSTGDSVATMLGAHLLDDDDPIQLSDALLDAGRAVGERSPDLASVNQDLSAELLVEDDIAEKLDLESLLDDRIASVNKSILSNMDSLSASLNASGGMASNVETIASEATQPYNANVSSLPGATIPPTEKHFRALIQGLGVERSELESRDPEQVAHAVGSALREAVIVLKAMRSDRVSAKQMLDMQTSQQDIDDATDTNINDEIVDLLLGRGQVYQKAADDMRASMESVRLHNAAMHKAARDAINAFLDQIAPEELAERFAAAGGKSGLFGRGKKSALWEQFERFYAVIAQRQPDTLPDFIKQEFERAYLASLRTLERSSQ
ncbi:MAG: type VI secretion system-associated FHA domain protein TagH [Pseudomonadota bacterium]